tara:strand:- start:1939 stop:2571 length:633 start_codon:yes stop_codon:yes gene_type:complete
MLSILYTSIISLKRPYWYNPIIHNFGNVGTAGNIHALCTPLFTKLIDSRAYSGVDIRKEIYSEIPEKLSVVDLCCGTGFSTKPGNIGVDTSTEMLRYSNLFNPGNLYKYGNAETFGEDREFDVVTCMFAFHEIPETGHRAIINNAIRISKRKVIIVDISTDYKPSKMMLSGEPYILDYIKNVDTLLENFFFEKNTLIPGHVNMWSHERTP